MLLKVRVLGGWTQTLPPITCWISILGRFKTSCGKHQHVYASCTYIWGLWDRGVRGEAGGGNTDGATREDGPGRGWESGHLAKCLDLWGPGLEDWDCFPDSHSALCLVTFPVV